MLLKKLYVQLMLVFLLAFLIPFSENYVRFFFTISQGFKDLLLFILPFFIIGCLSQSMERFSQKAPFVILLIVGGIFISTFLTLWFSYGLSSFLLPIIGVASKNAHQVQTTLNPYYLIPLKPILTTDKAVLVGVVIGFSMRWFSFMKPSMHWIYQKTSFVFRSFFIPLLPLYVFGFLTKLHFEGSLSWIIKTYSHVFITTLFIIFLYIIFFYGLSFGSKAFQALKTMLPAGFTGFCTSSSAVTMPLTIELTEKNINDRSFVNFIIPSTVNMHLMADNINNIVSVLSLLMMTGYALPSVSVFFTFSLFYLLTSLSFSAVPGGIVFVMLPLFEKHLSLPSDTFPLYITIMAIMDPFVTAGNVMGNGALAKLLHRYSFRCNSSAH